MIGRLSMGATRPGRRLCPGRTIPGPDSPLGPQPPTYKKEPRTPSPGGHAGLRPSGPGRYCSSTTRCRTSAPAAFSTAKYRPGAAGAPSRPRASHVTCCAPAARTPSMSVATR